ncbi:hypothetical protein [Streptomyces syringium]
MTTAQFLVATIAAATTQLAILLLAICPQRSADVPHPENPRA